LIITQNISSALRLVALNGVAITCRPRHLKILIFGWWVGQVDCIVMRRVSSSWQCDLLSPPRYERPLAGAHNAANHRQQKA